MIKLTQLDGLVIYLRKEIIDWVADVEGSRGSYIVLRNGSEVGVKESPEEVIREMEYVKS